MTRLPSILLLAIPLNALSQVGIGTATPHASAKLEVSATNQGFLPPRVSLTSTTDASTIASPAAGLLIYNLATAGSGPTGVTPGYFYYNGSSWSRVSTASGLDGLTDAKSGGDNFSNSLLIGSRTTGTLSSANGNTGVGIGVFNALTTGDINTAVGWDALKSLTTGSINSAFGYHALRGNTIGYHNTAIGSEALKSNTEGALNTAVGSLSLFNNTTGTENVSMGSRSMRGTSTGSYNVGVGTNSLYANTTGASNAAFGKGALYTNTTGSNNTAVGTDADVTAVDLTNASAIGYNAKVAASNTIQLGNTSVTSVNTSASVNAAAFNVTSDARLKRDMAPIDDALQIVLRLQPHRYDKRRSMGQDSDVTTEYGFLAQDLQSLLPELVYQAQDPDGTLSVNYTALIPILARAVQEQQETIDGLNARIDDLESRLRSAERHAGRQRQRGGR